MLAEDLARGVSVGKQTDLVLLNFSSRHLIMSITPSSFGSSTSTGSEAIHCPGAVPSWGTGPRWWYLMVRSQDLSL